MDRFHVVVSNYKRLFSFVENFHKIRNFNPRRDRVYILDCSPEEDWRNELEMARLLTEYGLEWGRNVIFVRRRNWAQNFGAILDYYRWMLAGEIQPVNFNFFLQEHYLDSERFLNADSIPEGRNVDLNVVEELFLSDPAIGCGFLSRYGVRISVSLPNLIPPPAAGLEGREQAPFKDHDGYYLHHLAEGGVRRFFFTDGGNFICRPEAYIHYFRSHRDELVQGNGSFGFCVAWEERLGKILCEQNVKWVDLHFGAVFRNLDELDAIEAQRGGKISSFWYQNMNWIYYYGYDLMPEDAKPVRKSFQPVLE